MATTAKKPFEAYDDFAEQCVLDAMWQGKELALQMASIVKPSDFYVDKHRLIAEAQWALLSAGKPVAFDSVFAYMQEHQTLAVVGGINAIMHTGEYLATATYAEEHAKRVLNLSVIRRAMVMLKDIYRLCGEAQDVGKLLEAAQRLTLEIGQMIQGKNTVKSMREVMSNVYQQVESAFDNPGTLTGVPSGFVDLDKMTAGWQKKDLIIIGARPSQGKTSFAQNMAEYAATKGTPVGFFSVEMPAEAIGLRALAGDTGINGIKMKKGAINVQELSLIGKSCGKLSDLPIYIDDISPLMIAEAKVKAQKMKIEHDIGILFVDYLGLVGSDVGQTRAQEVGYVTQGFKEIAKQLDIPVVLLCQLSRAVELKPDKRPEMSHLKESGDIEAHADVVAFIFREEYYNPDTERKGVAEIIVAKHRNGPTGTIELGWMDQRTKFVNLHKEAA